METTGKDGVPYRVHLEKSASGILPDLSSVAELEAEPPFPDFVSDVWICFRQLDARRMWNENGPVRFTWQDIKAFSEVTGVRLGRWYLQTIFRLDDKFLAVRLENKS